MNRTEPSPMRKCIPAGWGLKKSSGSQKRRVEVPPPVSARAKGSTGAVLVLVLWLGEPGVIRQIP